MTRRTGAGCRRRLRGWPLLLGCLAAVAMRAAPGDEPGPVPLLRDAGPARTESAIPASGQRGSLGDWRLVAALGGTFAVLVAARMAATRRVPAPPTDVFEVLGTASLGGQQAVRIVRFGPKTLLVGVSSAGATTLAEITDPQATACIAAACRAEQRQPRPAARGAASPVRGSREVA